MPYIDDILDRAIESHIWRRRKTINLIASENVLSPVASLLLASDFHGRYAEGHPGERYYEGTEYIDEIENLVKEDFKKIFNCDYVDVRPISGTVSNLAMFTKLINKGDYVIVNSTPGGGHISHHKYGAAGISVYDRKMILDFPLTEDGYHIDVDRTVEKIKNYQPALLIFGKSLFLFPEPVKELKTICDVNNILTVYDAAHVLGLIAGKRFQSPLEEGADFMVGSTHKTFYGPQRGIILSKNPSEKLWKKIDRGVFPGTTSNHHLHSLVALAIAAREIQEFGEEYAEQTIKNAKALAKELNKYFDVQAEEFGFTESHQIAVNVKEHDGGRKVASLLKDNDIITNCNLLPHEPVSHVREKKEEGIRLGVQEMTRYGMQESEMKIIADLMKRCIIYGEDVREDVNELRGRFTEMYFRAVTKERFLNLVNLFFDLK